MAVYQFYNPAPVFFDLLGTQLAANGTLEFYNAGGTTTTRNTWADSAKTTLNTNPVQLGPDARTEVPIFLDGDYTVVLKNALGAVIRTSQIISGAGAGGGLPVIGVGQFITYDGANYIGATIRELPDPSGSPSHYVTTDGANYILAPIPGAPTIPAPDIVVEDDATPKFQAGISTDPTKYVIQHGQATAPATGNKGTSVAITFPVPFAKLAAVHVTTTITAATASGALVDNSVPFTFMAASPGVTVLFNVSDDDNSSAWKISNPITFVWTAHGYIEVAPP